MKHLLVTFLLIILSNISSAQSGWGYVNYTSYKTHAGNGSTSQYPAHASNAAGFDVMFNTANSNTTITHTGQVPISYLYNGSLQIIMVDMGLADFKMVVKVWLRVKDIV